MESWHSREELAKPFGLTAKQQIVTATSSVTTLSPRFPNPRIELRLSCLTIRDGSRFYAKPATNMYSLGKIGDRCRVSEQMHHIELAR